MIKNTVNLPLVARLLAFCMLLSFSIQVFPVLEIGKVLSKQQVLEENGELETSCDDLSQTIINDDPVELFYLAKDAERARHHTSAVAVALQNSETLPLFFIPDILTPPPNFALS